MPKALGSVLIALTSVALLLSFTDVLGEIRAIIAIVTCFLTPGLALLFAVRQQRLGAWPTLALGIGLSPFVLGVLMTIFLFAGFESAIASRLCLFAVLATLIWIRIRPRPVENGEEEARVGKGAVFLALCITALLALPLASSNRVRASIHGMLHSSVLYSAVDRGVPPENPFFAGEPLRYYWTYHVAIAAPMELAAVEPTLVFTASNLFALFAFLLLLAALGRDLFGSSLAASLSIIIGFLGLNPLGAWFFMKRQPDVTLDRVAEGIDPIVYIRSMTIGGDDRISATFTKFMNVSSFPVSFTLLLASWFLIHRLSQNPGLGTGILAALSVAGTIALSPITGLTAGLALGVGAVLLTCSKSSRQGSIATICALAAGLACAIPFVLLGGGSSEGTVGLDPTLIKVERILWNLGPLIALALYASVRVARSGDSGGRLLIISLLPLLASAVVISFPVASEYKMIRMSAPLLGVFAAGTIALLCQHSSRWVRSAIFGLTLLAFLPTNALAWYTYLRHSEASLPYHGEGTQIEADEKQHQIMAAYRWIRENTPEDAIILDNPSAKQNHFAGPFHGDEIPVLARRPIFSDTPYYMTDYEPDFPRRFALIQSLFSEGRFTNEHYEHLLSLRRPVYLLIRASDPGFSRAAMAMGTDPRWHTEFQGNGGLVYKLRMKRR